VLLNRSHQHHDLILVANEEEKRLFDAIDGRRRVEDIARIAGMTNQDATRSFVERLWRYDQVVFDTTGALPGTQ
jgi:hypothetical protein